MEAELVQDFGLGFGLPNRRRPMTMLPYKSKFAALITKITKKASFEFTKLVEQLKLIEEMIRVDTFIYASVKDELEGRRALLNLWEHLMRLAEMVPAYRQNLFYTLIFFIVTRYEFDLIHLTSPMTNRHQKRKGLKSRHASQDIDVNPENLINNFAKHADDVEVFKEYRRLLVMQTTKVLDHFQSASLSKVLRKFCSQIMSIAYFRIPILSGPLMNYCCEETNLSDEEDDDEKISPLGKSWRARGRQSDWIQALHDTILDEFDELMDDSNARDINGKDKTSEFFHHNPTLFQWTLFVENDDHELLSKTECLSKLHQDRYFFKFISRLVAHVNDVLHKSPQAIDESAIFTEDLDLDLTPEQAEELYQYQIDRSISWGLIPGYWSLVRAVLSRCLVPLDVYRSDLKRCVLRLLANSDLLSVFARLYLLSTSVVRKHEVNACIDLLDAAFDAACGPNLDAPIPKSFCYELFFKAVDLLLASEQFEILLKILCFIYTHVGRFYGAERMALLQDILLNKYFFKFFLHWYPAVRRQFHHILVYKFSRVGVAELAHLKSADLADVHKDDDDDEKKDDNIKRSWLRRVGSTFAKVFSDGESLNQRRYSPSFSEEKSSPRKTEDISSEEIIRRNEAARMEMFKDPPVDSCEIICTRMSRDDLIEDEVIENNLQVYLHMLERQMEDPSQEYFDQSMTVYVDDALEQYRNLRQSMQRLQKQKNLKRFEVLTPSMYYDIPQDPRDID